MTESPPPKGPADTASETSGEGRGAALSRELSQFLLELSIGVHRYGMYPRGHPSRWAATENVVGSLGSLLQDRGNLSIGVAFDQLVIQGVPTDPNQPVLRELAQRLHRHQVAAIAFSRGVDVDELQGLMETLASEAEQEGDPIGLRAPEDLPSWEHVRIFPVGYDQVELSEGEEGDEEREPARATQLWIGLAQAALAGEEPLDPDSPPEGGLVAHSINRHGSESAYEQVIVGYLHQLAQELHAGEGGETESVGKRISELIDELDEGALKRLVEMGGDVARRKRFVIDANQSLAVESVVKIVAAASEASDLSVSGSLTRLLSKLAAHAEQGSGEIRSHADTALRANVEELVSRWESGPSGPEGYGSVLDNLSRYAPALSEEEEAETEEAESPEESGIGRLLLTALEVEALGPMVDGAVGQLLDQGELGWLLQVADQAPADNRVAEHLEELLAVPERLAMLLSGDDVDETTLQSLVERIGVPALDPLMEALSESESRSIRRKVFDCLAGLDHERYPVAEKVMEGLSDPRWYVKRNMLGLLQELDSSPSSGMEYLRHSEPQVRREAFQLAIRNPDEREEAVEIGLADSDERLVRMALLEAEKDGISHEAAEIVRERIISRGEMSELRFLAVRVLRNSDAPAALDGLVDVALGGRTFWGRRKLSEKSSELMVALAGLAEHWHGEPRAQRALKLARKAKDPEIQAAVTSGGLA